MRDFAEIETLAMLTRESNQQNMLLASAYCLFISVNNNVNSYRELIGRTHLRIFDDDIIILLVLENENKNVLLFCRIV